MDREPVDRDACRPASRAARLLKDIQAALDAHDTAVSGAPPRLLESRVEFQSPEEARVHRRVAGPGGTEVAETVHVVLDGGAWRVVGVEPAV